MAKRLGQLRPFSSGAQPLRLQQILSPSAALLLCALLRLLSAVVLVLLVLPVPVVVVLLEVLPHVLVLLQVHGLLRPPRLPPKIHQS